MKENKCKYEIESGSFICTDAENCSFGWHCKYLACVSQRGNFCMCQEASEDLLKATFIELEKLKKELDS